MCTRTRPCQAVLRPLQTRSPATSGGDYLGAYAPAALAHTVRLLHRGVRAGVSSGVCRGQTSVGPRSGQTVITRLIAIACRLVRGSCISFRPLKNKDPPKRKKAPSNMPRPRRMQGLQLVDSWSSRPGEPFAGLPKCFEAAGQKEVSCAGLRGRVLGAGGAPGGAALSGPLTGPPPCRTA
jgi:hypothetical protein